MDYVDFLTHLPTPAAHLLTQWARVLFVIPEFLTFLSDLLALLPLKPDDISAPGHLDRFFQSFREQWEATRDSCPLYLVTFLRGVADPETILFDCFFAPLLEFPLAYGFMVRENCWTREIRDLLAAAFSSHSHDGAFARCLRSVNSR
jgi:hypothetical protein